MTDLIQTSTSLVYDAFVNCNWLATFIANIVVFVAEGIFYTFIVADLFTKLAHPVQFNKMKNGTAQEKKEAEDYFVSSAPYCLIVTLITNQIFQVGLWHIVGLLGGLDSYTSCLQLSIFFTFFVFAPSTIANSLWKHAPLGLIVIDLIDLFLSLILSLVTLHYFGL